MKPWNELTHEEKMACVSIAIKDPNWEIRLGAYREQGYTPEALKDTNPNIRREAEIYLRVKNIDQKTQQQVS